MRPINESAIAIKWNTAEHLVLVEYSPDIVERENFGTGFEAKLNTANFYPFLWRKWGQQWNVVLDPTTNTARIGTLWPKLQANIPQISAPFKLVPWIQKPTGFVTWI